MAAAEGVGGLYRGLLPSAAAILPEAAITYGLFDTLKVPLPRCMFHHSASADCPSGCALLRHRAFCAGLF